MEVKQDVDARAPGRLRPSSRAMPGHDGESTPEKKLRTRRNPLLSCLTSLRADRTALMRRFERWAGRGSGAGDQASRTRGRSGAIRDGRWSAGRRSPSLLRGARLRHGVRAGPRQWSAKGASVNRPWRLPALHFPLSRGRKRGKGVPAPRRMGGGALAKLSFRASEQRERGPESITPILSMRHGGRTIAHFVVMDSGLRPSAGPGMTGEIAL